MISLSPFGVVAIVAAPASAQMAFTEAAFVASIEQIAGSIMYGAPSNAALSARQAGLLQQAVSGVVSQYRAAGWSLHELQPLISRGVSTAASHHPGGKGSILHHSVNNTVQIIADTTATLGAAASAFLEGFLSISSLLIIDYGQFQWLYGPQLPDLALVDPRHLEWWQDIGQDYYEETMPTGDLGGFTAMGTTGLSSSSSGASSSSDQPTNIRGSDHTSDGTWLTPVGCFPPLPIPEPGEYMTPSACPVDTTGLHIAPIVEIEPGVWMHAIPTATGGLLLVDMW